MDFQTLSNWIILIGAVVVALVNIFKFLYNTPVSFFKKKKERDRIKKENELMEILAKAIPRYLCEYEKDNYPVWLKNISTDITDAMQKQLEEYKLDNERIHQEMESLQIGTVNLLRRAITEIYYTYKGEKKLPRYIRETLNCMYEAYSLNHGNFYISKIYKRMCDWEVIDTDDEQDI